MDEVTKSHLKLPQAPSILAVDDTPANLKLLFGLLKERGYRVRPVPSGALALQAATAEPPDLILLDIGMPEMDGFEVCARLKADPRTKDVPIIFLSAHTDTEEKVKAFAVGGVDYVTKPFQFAEVDARVATHLELRCQKRELQQSYDTLAELEKSRDSLVHMIVHDLRAPLAAMCAFLELLENDTRDVLSAENHGDIEEALAAAKKMAGMVSAILDVNKLEAGKLVPARSECNVVALAAEVVGSLGSLAGDRVVTVAREQAAVTAQVDRDLVSRVIQNLLANALKFTPACGSVRVTVVQGADVVRVEVADSGPGIAPADREKIFEKFGQVSARAEGRQGSSTGLGLAFCKLAVEAHGGCLGVDSEQGEGATFWFTLPAGAPHGQS